MKIKHYYKIIFSAIISLFIVSMALIIVWEPSENLVFFDNKNIDSNFHELRDFIKQNIDNAQDDYQGDFDNQYIQIGFTSHHLPVAATFISEFYTNLYHSQGPRDIFVILGPDHFERGYQSVSTTFYPFNTLFGEMQIEKEIVAKLVKVGVNIDNQALEGEHSIGIHTIFTKLLFPQARLVPLIFRADTSEEEIDNIVKVLSDYKDKIIIIGSVDFSHYQSYQNAQVFDKESMNMISDFNFDSFTLEYVDSPPSMKVIGRLIKTFDANNISFLTGANSYNFTERSDNTTGYINALFSEEILGSAQILMFVGDIMLSRSVGDKMEQENDWKWPFLKISQYLGKADFLFGNLEGPISDKGRNVGGIYSFRVDPLAINGLKYVGFDILSLANNHIGDWGREAMEDTFKILEDSDINYIGGGYNKEEANSSIIKELGDGTKIAFLAYTNLGSRYWQAKKNQSGIAWLEEGQMESDIKKVKQKTDMVIVSMHFGEEYLTYSNTSQQFFARAAIDAGADLVVGHHPHVVQEIEKYKNGYIAYSLGNFVFDQNFSELTKQGLILEVIVEDNQIKEVRPVEIRISDSFQPELISE